MMEMKRECGIEAAGLSCKNDCPLIDEMAGRIAEELEESAEYDFGSGEEDIIVGLVKAFYLRKAYREAAALILLSFSLIENGEAAMILDVVLSCEDDNMTRLFIESFLMKCGSLPSEVILGVHAKLS